MGHWPKNLRVRRRTCCDATPARGTSPVGAEGSEGTPETEVELGEKWTRVSNERDGVPGEVVQEGELDAGEGVGELLTEQLEPSRQSGPCDMRFQLLDALQCTELSQEKVINEESKAGKVWTESADPRRCAC